MSFIWQQVDLLHRKLARRREDSAGPPPNRIWFRAEFIEYGPTINLLSIGMLNRKDEVYYAEVMERDRTKAGPWVCTNVLPRLTGPVKPRKVIKAEIVDFAGSSPEFWGYRAAYDWVALCQLFGHMTDLPTGWPTFCMDVKQLAAARGKQWSPLALDDNHPLPDAIWTKYAWESLR